MRKEEDGSRSIRISPCYEAALRERESHMERMIRVGSRISGLIWYGWIAEKGFSFSSLPMEMRLLSPIRSIF